MTKMTEEQFQRLPKLAQKKDPIVYGYGYGKAIADIAVVMKKLQKPTPENVKLLADLANEMLTLSMASEQETLVLSGGK